MREGSLFLRKRDSKDCRKSERDEGGGAGRNQEKVILPRSGPPILFNYVTGYHKVQNFFQIIHLADELHGQRQASLQGSKQEDNIRERTLERREHVRTTREYTGSVHIAYLPSTCRQSMGPTENRATLFWRNEVNMRRRT